MDRLFLPTHEESSKIREQVDVKNMGRSLRPLALANKLRDDSSTPEILNLAYQDGLKNQGSGG